MSICQIWHQNLIKPVVPSLGRKMRVVECFAMAWRASWEHTTLPLLQAHWKISRVSSGIIRRRFYEQTTLLYLSRRPMMLRTLYSASSTWPRLKVTFKVLMTCRESLDIPMIEWPSTSFNLDHREGTCLLFCNLMALEPWCIHKIICNPVPWYCCWL